MHIQEKSAGDATALVRLVRGARDAEQRDRYRVVLLALEGLETRTIQDRVGRSRGFVQRWAYAYRDGGLAGREARPRGGSAPKLPPEQRAEYDRARDRGRTLLQEGKVAAFTVAGGQGTRLGVDGPKGAVPITPVRNKSLFQLFAETIRAAGN